MLVVAAQTGLSFRTDAQRRGASFPAHARSFKQEEGVVAPRPPGCCASEGRTQIGNRLAGVLESLSRARWLDARFRRHFTKQTVALPAAVFEERHGAV